MGFLADVARETRASISRPGYAHGLGDGTNTRIRPSLKEAILHARPPGALLVEFKRVSPGSETPALPTRSIAEFVRATAHAEIAGYSCIATVPRFQGSPQDVAEMVGRTDRPVLYKDFILDPVQIDIAARAGASAVLLIARLETEGLLTTSLRELSARAHSRGLEVLLEFHDRSELRHTAGVAADVYGVNVRDLDTLRLEPAVASETLRLATKLRPLLGLSGVAGPADALRLWNDGVDGILVGTSVARSARPSAFLESLRRPVAGGDS